MYSFGVVFLVQILLCRHVYCEVSADCVMGWEGFLNDEGPSVYIQSHSILILSMVHVELHGF